MQQRASDASEVAWGLRELILEHRDETEVNRQVAPAIVDALVASGLGRMALPRDHAGLEVPPPEQLDVLEALARAEASVAWIVWNSSLPCWFARFLPEEPRREIFDDPRALYASSTRPTGRAVRDGDSYVVNGRWSLVSGCMHAKWIPVTSMVETDGEVEMLAPGVPHMRLLFVPRESHEILDTWHVGGLRGTGSHDSVLSEVAVPAEHSFAFGDASRMDTPMGRVPIVANMSAGCASICVGIATTSLQALVDLAGGKGAVDGGPGLRDRAPAQSLVARVEARLEAARALLRSASAEVWRKAEAGAERDASDIAALFGAAITTALDCRAAVTEIYAAAGASALYTDSPIERAHRDIHAVTQHIALQPFWLEQAGRVRLGLEPTHPLFWI